MAYQTENKRKEINDERDGSIVGERIAICVFTQGIQKPERVETISHSPLQSGQCCS